MFCLWKRNKKCGTAPHGKGVPMEKLKALKGDFSGYASVRIDKKNRIIFSVDENTVTVIQCCGHYDDK